MTFSRRALRVFTITVNARSLYTTFGQVITEWTGLTLYTGRLQPSGCCCYCNRVMQGRGTKKRVGHRSAARRRLSLSVVGPTRHCATERSFVCSNIFSRRLCRYVSAPEEYLRHSALSDAACSLCALLKTIGLHTRKSIDKPRTTSYTI